MKKFYLRHVLGVVFLLTSQITAFAQTTYFVTNLNDAGAGSLRQAITDLNATGNATLVNTIDFSGIPSGLLPGAIAPVSALATINRPVIINGYTALGAAAGAIGSRNIRLSLDLGGIGNSSGFIVNASNVSISGFSFVRNSGTNTANAIRVNPNFSNTWIWGNYIGVGNDGTTPSPNNLSNGIILQNSGSTVFANIVIGTNGDGADDGNEGNVIGQLSTHGISAITTNNTYSDIKVAGNYMGLAADGTTALPIAASGVFFDGNATSPYTSITNLTVGTNGDGISDALERNVIVNITQVNPGINNSPGCVVLREMNATNTRISGNYMGLMPNNTISSTISAGITLEEANNMLIGTDANGVSDELERNVIANGFRAINIMNAQSNYDHTPKNIQIAGNYLNTDNTGLVSYAGITSATGIYLLNSDGIFIGFNDGNPLHTAASAAVVRNVIGGAGNAYGIHFVSGYTNALPSQSMGNNVIAGNYIGVGADGTTPLGWRTGISIVGQSFHSAGNITSLSGNANNRIGSNDNGVLDEYEGNIIANSGVGGGIQLLAGSTSLTMNTEIIPLVVNNRISRNTFYSNTENAINISSSAHGTARVNDGEIGKYANDGMDYPVITSTVIDAASGTVTAVGYVGACNGSEIVGPNNTTFANVTVQLYLQEDDGDQNGPVSTGCTANSYAHGEGRTYLMSATADANGNFTATFPLPSGFTTASKLTGLSIDASGNTSDFGISVTPIVPLPVALKYFRVTSETEGAGARLSWATTSETNSDRFEIEHSLNARSWNQIGTIQSVGESSMVRPYLFNHIEAISGINYYRLKMVDRDGTYAFSRIERIDLGKISKAIIYPNPASDFVMVEGAQQIRILNLHGVEVVANYLTNGRVNVSQLPMGTYILEATNSDGTRSVSKFIIFR